MSDHLVQLRLQDEISKKSFSYVQPVSHQLLHCLTKSFQLWGDMRPPLHLQLLKRCQSGWFGCNNSIHNISTTVTVALLQDLIYNDSVLFQKSVHQDENNGTLPYILNRHQLLLYNIYFLLICLIKKKNQCAEMLEKELVEIVLFWESCPQWVVFNTDQSS